MFQCLSVSRPSDTGLGPFPNYLGHGTCRQDVDTTLTNWPFQILVGILRHYIVVLLQSPPKQLSRAAVREQCVLEIEFSSYSRTVCHIPDVL